MRRLPFLSNSDRRALLALEWILMLVVLGFFVYTWMHEDKAEKPLQTSLPTSQVKIKRSSAKSMVYAVEEEPLESFPFDPNTADSTTLLRLGLAPWQVRAVYRYRAKHGRYHRPEDFARLPGMTNEMWKRLGPLVCIAEEFRYVDIDAISTPIRSSSSVSANSGQQRKTVDSAERVSYRGLAKDGQITSVSKDTVLMPEKYRELTQVDLNRADTNELKKIPGIASYRAVQIVRYREKLGGFVSTEQVMESCSLPDEVLDWFCLTDTRTRKINLNKASVQAMRRHPYITFYQARAIYEHRHDKGALRSPDDLLLLKEFTQRDVERLKPYIDF